METGAEGKLFSNIEDRVKHEEQLVNTTVFRAVAAVAEAISQSERGVQFSLIEDTALSVARTGVATLATTRPGNEVLIPWTPSNGHISLYVVRRNGASNNFNLGHFDSASSAHHRSIAARTDAGQLIRRALDSTGWNNAGLNTITSGLPVNVNQTRQRAQWECGIHTVLSAWAYALGLELADTVQAGGIIYNDFLRQGRLIINAALCGYIDSETIRAFLECFGFIRAGQTVPAERSFSNTILLETENQYRHLNGRNRIRTELDLRRANGDMVPTMDTVLAELADRGADIDNFADYDAQQLLDELAMIVGTEDVPRALGTQTIPQSGDTAAPQSSPIDPDQLALNQALLAEAASLSAERAARLAAAEEADRAARSGSAGAAVSESDAGTPSRATRGPNGDNGTSSAPPPPDSDDSDNGGDSAPPGAGASVVATQEGATQLPSDPTTPDNPTLGNTENPRSATPGSISGAESDDGDGFFGTSPSAPPAEAPPVEEHPDLVAFREEQASRVERARAAEDRRTAVREAEEQTARDAATARAEADAREQAFRAGHDGLGPMSDVPDAGPQGFQEDLPPIEPYDEDDEDNGSLFGDDSPSPPPVVAPPAHPSGLSLPPTPIAAAFPRTSPTVEPSSSLMQGSPEEEEPVVETTFADDDEGGAELNQDMDVVETTEEVAQPGPTLELSAAAAAVVARWQIQDGGADTEMTDADDGGEDEREIGDGYESPS